MLKGDYMKRLSRIKELWNAFKPINKWMPSDLAIYISDYMEQHPDKKLTRRLEHKLKHKYYSALRKSGK